MADMEYVELVEDTARARGDKAILRKFILAAIQGIETGEEDVDRYPITNAPSLKGVYEIAARLEAAEAQLKQ